MQIKLIVTGMHRSGTTWLGQLVSRVQQYAVIHEPFNYELGLKGVPAWYLDPRDTAHEAYLMNSLEQLASGRGKFQTRFRRDRPLRYLASLLVGTGAARIYQAATRSENEALAIKDPFLIRMAPRLAANGYKVLVSVRHPLAILRSLKRMDWPLIVPGINDKSPFAPVGLEEEMAKVCSMWCELYGPILEYLERQGQDNVFIADHSTIFHDVERFGTALVNFLELDGEQTDLKRFLADTTSGSTVMPDHSKLHEFSRDSRKLAEAWRLEYSSKQLSQVENLLGSKLARLGDASHSSIVMNS